jgi:hypothetical protein
VVPRSFILAPWLLRSRCEWSPGVDSGYLVENGCSGVGGSGPPFVYSGSQDGSVGRWSGSWRLVLADPGWGQGETAVSTEGCGHCSEGDGAWLCPQEVV